VFSANKFGFYLKNRVMPSHRSTTLANNGRTAFACLPELWRSTSPAQRAAWAVYAAAPAQEKTNSLGQKYYLTNYQWFVALNTRLTWFFIPPLLDAPNIAAPTPPAFALCTVYNSGIGGSEFVFVDIDFSTLHPFVEIGIFPTKTDHLSDSNFLACYRGPIGMSSPTNIQTEIESLWGTISDGCYFLSRIYRMDHHGQRSTYIQSGAPIG